jgi:hypothetical protein
LTYKQVVAFHPSPSKGFSHMPGNIKHTIAQYYLVTNLEPHQTEFNEPQSKTKGKAVRKHSLFPAWKIINVSADLKGSI